MKKGIIKLLAISCTLLLAVGLTACKGESAYDLAKKNGFSGTESEWLLSLKGENGEDGEDLDAQALYVAAVEQHGYEGSFLDFCKALNISMPQYNDTVQIAENMMSVVSIYCGYTTKVVTGADWLGRPITSTGYGTQAGSGVIVDLNKEGGNAYILTNFHVVYNKESLQGGLLDNIYVYPYGAYNMFDPKNGDTKGDGIKATVVGGSMDYDIAVLKVEGSEKLKASNVTEAKMGNSDKVIMGEETYAIGNPAGAGISVTNGILSVDSEYIAMGALDGRDEDRDGKADEVTYRVMRTSAAINSGNSGGGLFNTRGELIGIVNAKSGEETTDNMGYALPISQVKAVYENILYNVARNGGNVRQATLGVMVQITASKAMLDEDGNVYVQEEFRVAEEVDRDRAAYRKLSMGDIFLSVRKEGGETITFVREYQLTDFLLGVRQGETIIFTVRNSSNQVEEVSITFDKEEYFTLYL